MTDSEGSVKMVCICTGSPESSLFADAIRPLFWLTRLKYNKIVVFHSKNSSHESMHGKMCKLAFMNNVGCDQSVHLLCPIRLYTKSLCK